MMRYASSSTFRAVAPRDGHVLNVVGSCHPYAAHVLAAEDHIQAAIAAADRARLQREAGMPPLGSTARLTSFRTRAGAALMRFGEQVAGRPASAAGAAPGV